MKSIFSIIMTGALLLSMLTACGKKTNNGVVATATAAPTPTATTVTETDRPIDSDRPEITDDDDDTLDDTVNDLVGEDGNVADGDMTDNDDTVVEK